MLKIVCINGAPGTGKDTVGGMLVAKHLEIKNTGGVKIMKMAHPLDHIAQKLIGATNGEYKLLREEQKDRVLTEFNMKVSLRRLLINISEKLIKPNMGKVWFAQQCADKIRSLKNMVSVVFITDCGFQYEFDHFKESVSDIAYVRLINLQRDGHTFEDDSRENVSDGDDTIVIHNNGSLDELNQMLDLEMFNV